MPTTQ